MPILAGLLVSLFSGITGFFAKWLSKKLAIGVAAVAVLSGLTVALFLAIGGMLSTIVAVIPSDSGLIMGLWIVLPDNAQACIAATIAADTAIALYRWNVENLRIMSYVT